MGGGSSTPPRAPSPPRRPRQASPPRPSPFLDQPWRKINWGNNQSALQFVKNYEPPIGGQQIRVLLHGPAGAGKSSFINSVYSVLYGRVCTIALADNTSGDSFTKMYKTYKIPKGGRPPFYPFVFSDIMGLERNKGVLVDDIKLALKGHVKEGYKFNPVSSLSEGDQLYNNSPTANDKVQVLICVIPANTPASLEKETVEKIREVRMAASELGIPQMVLLTKIDEACPQMKGKLQDVYRVKKVKEKMEEFSANVGIPMNCIFPVKNYDSEIDPDKDIDSLVLSAMRSILNFAEDYILMNQSDCSDIYA